MTEQAKVFDADFVRAIDRLGETALQIKQQRDDLLAALTDALAAFDIIAHHALSNGVKQLAVDNAEKVRVAITRARGE